MITSLRAQSRRGVTTKSVSFEKIKIDRVRKVINLLGLPGTKPFDIVADVQPIARRLDLLGKGKRIRRQIESFGCEDSGGLMVVIFPDIVVRHPGKNDFAGVFCRSLIICPWGNYVVSGRGLREIVTEGGVGVAKGPANSSAQ